ncbi:hypothetical protein GCM10010324_65710 [Streptomyces hiroshimensis]|uniref:Uncharacterized protein n=1 Tax=Streptomyces hiroshimensis TaxID=66424 RepID=A0ABQ2ZA81_9ACTN|nr:hypothetical protein GCM10010324_65710 [Streptomyces hiroshimensis]
MPAGDHDLGALTGERKGGSAADALAAPGDQDNFACESLGHRVSPVSATAGPDAGSGRLNFLQHQGSRLSGEYARGALRQVSGARTAAVSGT